jgi:hypothetical protein
MTYRIIGLAEIALLFCLAAIRPDVAQAQTAQEMIGSWALVANVNIREDGTRVDVYGADPKGIQIFDSSGISRSSPRVPTSQDLRPRIA